MAREPMGAPEIRARRAGSEPAARGRAVRLPALLRLVMRQPRECLLVGAAATALVAIVVNALYLQPGRHPSPIFAISPPVAAAAASSAAVGTRQRGPVAEVVRQDPAARPRAEIIADVQRELTRRGFFDSPVDGTMGAKTDAAIRDFEQSAGLKPTGEPSEALLQSIARTPAAARAAAPRKDPIAGLIASSRQLAAVQRALSDSGYGPLETNGVLGSNTRAAIERFERDRRIPITGQVSERVIRELSAVTGRPL
jgi:peptidoglycan hydrolase-like protein with peptidoglycan-binding domain